jgi:cobalamin biosynthesis protein CobD/CbiB
MYSFLVVAVAVFLDRLLGEPAIYHPLRGFARFTTFIEDGWHRQLDLPFQPTHIKPAQEEKLTPATIKVIDTTEKVKGGLAVLFLVLPFMALAALLSQHLIIPFNFILMY